MLTESIQFCEKIEMSALPYVSYADKSKLPSLPGIYFVVENGVMVYIGRTDNFNYRLFSHDKKQVFNSLENPLVYYLICNDEPTRKMYERIMIGIHSPKLNDALKRDGLDLFTKCVECGSLNTYKNGRSNNQLKTQKYKCGNCGYQFTPTTDLIPCRPITNLLPWDHNCCSAKLRKDGYYKGQQKYRCQHCRKTYIDRSATVNKDQ